MSITIVPMRLKTENLSVGAFCFVPSGELARDQNGEPIVACMTHGYTSHKGDLVQWADRLATGKIPTVIFDLPGHWLGSFDDVTSWEVFLSEVPQLFDIGIQELGKNINGLEASTEFCFKIYGGHSLGALLSLQALQRLTNKDKALGICVGLGISQQKTHLFESSIYQKTLNTRKQLVSPKLSPETVLPWIRDTKTSLIIRDANIHLICGKDDAVVGSGGAQAMMNELISNGNHVTIDEPKTLPHNRPEMAAAFIFSFLKKNVLGDRSF